jgi:hypothetical protein
MVYCQAQTPGGARCGRDATQQSYFWYYDPHLRVNKVFHLCQDHSNKIINQCIQKEMGTKHLIDRLYKNIEEYKIKKKSSNYSEQRDAIKNTKENGIPVPKFKSMLQLDAEISEFYRKIKHFKGLNNLERNHTCRYEKCNYFLKEPNDKEDQIGKSFAHADFHSGNGYRREVIMFHTECGISWLLANVLLTDKELKYIRPQRTQQGVLEI